MNTPRTDTGPNHGSSRGHRRLWRLPAAALGALLAASVVSGTAAAATGTGSNAGSAGTVAQSVHKPAPTVPANAAKGTPLVTPKPKLAKNAAVKPLVAWSVTTTVSRSVLWPTQYTTITATANQDLGPTPYYLSIFEDEGGGPLAICGTGTTCSVAVTQPTAVTALHYEGIISTYPTATAWWNQANIQMVGNRQQVQWLGMELGVAADHYTAAVGGQVTLFADTTLDVGPSPFYIELFDATTGTLLNSCGTGVVCNVLVSQLAATTHRYVAYVAGNSTTMPPPTVQNTTEPIFATWSTTGWSVALTTAGTPGGGTQSVTATASGDVGPTPYYIELFDVDAGTRIGICGTGTTCTVAYNTYGHVVAFVSANDAALLPANIQADSNTVETSGPPIS